MKGNIAVVVWRCGSLWWWCGGGGVMWWCGGAMVWLWCGGGVVPLINTQDNQGQPSKDTATTKKLQTQVQPAASPPKLVLEI